MSDEITYVKADKIKTLEEYAISIVAGMISLQTLERYHLRAIEIGILKDTMNCRANTMTWDFRRLMALYIKQLEEVLELLPTKFNVEFFTDVLKKHHLQRARSMIRKKKDKNA